MNWSARAKLGDRSRAFRRDTRRLPCPALCTVDGVNSLARGRFIAHAGNAVYQLVDYRPAPRIAVLGFAGVPGSADVELLFTQDSAATTRFELRFGFSDEIGRRRYERELWGVVEGCTTGART